MADDRDRAGLFADRKLPELLERRGGVIDGRDRALFDPDRLRVDYPGRRPMVCPP